MGEKYYGLPYLEAKNVPLIFFSSYIFFNSINRFIIPKGLVNHGRVCVFAALLFSSDMFMCYYDTSRSLYMFKAFVVIHGFFGSLMHTYYFNEVDKVLPKGYEAIGISSQMAFDNLSQVLNYRHNGKI